MKPCPRQSAIHRSVLLVAACGALFLAASTANATSMNHSSGISLADLIEDPTLSFESGNGELVFSGFGPASPVEGLTFHDLSLYRVVPLDDGFKLLSPLLTILGHEAELELEYTVETTSDAIGISGIDYSMYGFALGGSNEAVLSALEGAGDEVAWLVLHREGLFGGPGCGYDGHHGDGDHTHDYADIDPVAALLEIHEEISAKTGLLAGTVATKRRFSTAPIPEPTTALLLGLGLTGLAFSGRRRAGQEG